MMDHDNASDTYESIENLIGTGMDDTLTGNAANNYIDGGGGDDIIDGGAGDDIIDGRDRCHGYAYWWRR